MIRFVTSEITKDLIYASFFFIDIVGLSNPILSTETQRVKIKVLNEIIYGCKSFSDTPQENILILPTGDGMLIAFQNGLEEPLKLAIEFHQKISKYNEKVTSVEKIETRIGCNVGYVFVVKDIYGKRNLWGPGAILARRVMDLGTKGHILLSAEFAKDLMEISTEYEKIIHPIHNFGIKHGEDLLVYSAFGEGFGNSNAPNFKKNTNSIEKPIEENSTCKKIIHNIIVKELEEPIRFERYFYFSNKLKEPIHVITVGLITNSEEEFKQLQLKAFDEKNKELEISKIVSQSPLSKLITIKFLSPIFPHDSEKMIKIIYYSKLTKNIFENFFMTDTESFELNFSHYSNERIFPALHYLNNLQGIKTLLEPENVAVKGIFTTHKWEKQGEINLKDMIRLQW